MIKNIDTILTNLCIMINIFAVYLMYKDVMCIREELKTMNASIEQLTNGKKVTESCDKVTEVIKPFKQADSKSGETKPVATEQDEKTP